MNKEISNGVETKRHSLAHILAHAIKNLYPNVKLGMGPAIENGFYYDFNDLKISDTDLPKIENEMKKIIKQNISFEKKEVSKEEAEDLFINEPYKLELIKDLYEVGPRAISVYKSGNFVDLCAGPHINSTKEINPESFKLTRIAGAYWKGDEKNKMLTRIYGVAFNNKKELKNHLALIEEAKKRDHRILGQKLDLFIFDEEVGPGLPLWQPKGAILRHIIENYLFEKLSSQGYQWLITPHIGRLALWKTSGHWELYRENIYSPIEIEKDQYLLKPMNCPFHVKIYNSKIRSYKELPLKFAELGTVYRYEKSGVLHGLTRVRGFTQDDAHLICPPEQMDKELEKLVKQGLNILKKFGFKKYSIYLSTRPEKYAGKIDEWEKATKTLKKVLEKLKLKYEIDPAGGVFYGPKIDIKIKDALSREWQCTTIQFDFNLPEKFKMAYINKKGEKQKPYMIHRALLGSMERFIGVLLEHYQGALPLWLSPVQIWVMPISSSQKKYAKEITKQLKSEGLRVELKDDNETIGKKIREAEIQKIPYSFIIGKKEVKSKTVSVRERKKGDIGKMKIKKFIEKKIGFTETRSR